MFPSRLSYSSLFTFSMLFIVCVELEALDLQHSRALIVCGHVHKRRVCLSLSFVRWRVADLRCFTSAQDRERLRQNAAAREQQNPVSFALRNSWAQTLTADKNPS